MTCNISFKVVEAVRYVRVVSHLSLWVFWSAVFKRQIKFLLASFIFCSSYLPAWPQESIEVVRMKEQPLVVGKLNGKNAYFLVDTGADISILNETDTKRYKISYRKTQSNGNMISGLVSRHEREILVATNANLYLGEKKIAACFKLLDITNIKQSIGRDSGVWINGIIGTDVMKRYNFILDYSRQEIRFSHFVHKRTTCL